MADEICLPREAVEAGARALADYLNLDYDRIGDGQKTLTRQAEALLAAAAPHIAAAYAERKGKEISGIADGFLRSGKTTKGRWYGHIGGQLQSEARNIRNGKPRS